MNERDFAWIRDFVRAGSGLCLDDDKAYLAEFRLEPLARGEGFPSLSTLIAHLATSCPNGLHARVLEAMTTNETSFFRDVHPFDAIRGWILPKLIERRRDERRLVLWSAACSSGQEPYSLAMILRDEFPAVLSGWDVRLTGTDLSAGMIARAKAATYTQLEVNRGLPAPMLVRHFTRAGSEWEVAPALRRMVTATECNLAAPLPRMGPFDVVYLRNVLIYFDLPTKQVILRRVRELMRPDGWLFLGAAETTLGVDDSWERVVVGRSSAYRPLKGA